MINFDNLQYGHITPADMPTPTMQAVAETCGVKYTLIIIDKFGGQTLAIPSKRETGLYGRIVCSCGKTVADELFYMFSGESIHIPTRKSLLPLIINQLNIDADTLPWLIHTYGITRTTVYKMLRSRNKNFVKNDSNTIAITLKHLSD